MKKIAVFAAFIMLCGTVSAQNGIEAGAFVQPQIYGQYFAEPIADRAFKIPYAFAIGIDVGYNLTDNFGVRTGFTYTPQGDKYVITSTTPEQSYDVNLEYIQVPLLLKLNGSTDRTASLLFLAGPHISFLNNATTALNTEDPVSTLGDYKRVIYGGTVGLGLQLNLSDGGNLNALWMTSASAVPVQTEQAGVSSNGIVSGLQISYHYFLNL